MLLDITFELTTLTRPITGRGRDSQSSAAAATPRGTRHGERHLAALRLSGGEGGSRRIRRRRMRLPELLGGLARPMHQPIRLPGILGHRRSAYLRPSALSVSGVLPVASRRSPVIALVAFEEPRSVRLLINGCRLAVAAGDDLSVNSSARYSIIDTNALGGSAFSTRGSEASDKPSDNALRQGPT